MFPLPSSFYSRLEFLLSGAFPSISIRPLLDTLLYTLHSNKECRVEYKIIEDCKMRYKKAVDIIIKIALEFMKGCGLKNMIKESKLKLKNETRPGLKRIFKERHYNKTEIYEIIKNVFEQIIELLMRYTTTNSQTKARCEPSDSSTKIWSPEKRKFSISFFPSPKLLSLGYVGWNCILAMCYETQLQRTEFVVISFTNHRISNT